MTLAATGCHPGFILDDKAAAKAFVISLNRKVVRQRFSGTAPWDPDRLVLALRGERSVAMADCIVSPDLEVANVSLLAAPGHGAWAVRALLRLKRAVGARHWLSTLRAPTPATIAVSRRYCDVTYDQVAWEIATGLAEAHGPHAHLEPTPLFASDAYLAEVGLPRLWKWSEADRNQLLTLAADPSRGVLETPSGKTIHITDLTAIAFDLLAVPVNTRQSITRIMISGIAAAHGHDASILVPKLADPADLGRFLQMLEPYRRITPQGCSLLSLQRHIPGALNQAIDDLTAGRLPSDRRHR